MKDLLEDFAKSVKKEAVKYSELLANKVANAIAETAFIDLRVDENQDAVVSLYISDFHVNEFDYSGDLVMSDDASSRVKLDDIVYKCIIDMLEEDAPENLITMAESLESAAVRLRDAVADPDKYDVRDS